jgi:hypothetical protein
MYASAIMSSLRARRFVAQVERDPREIRVRGAERGGESDAVGPGGGERLADGDRLDETRRRARLVGATETHVGVEVERAHEGVGVGDVARIARRGREVRSEPRPRPRRDVAQRDERFVVVSLAEELHGVLQHGLRPHRPAAALRSLAGEEPVGELARPRVGGAGGGGVVPLRLDDAEVVRRGGGALDERDVPLAGMREVRIGQLHLLLRQRVRRLRLSELVEDADARRHGLDELGERLEVLRRLHEARLRELDRAHELRVDDGRRIACELDASVVGQAGREIEAEAGRHRPAQDDRLEVGERLLRDRPRLTAASELVQQVPYCMRYDASTSWSLRWGPSGRSGAVNPRDKSRARWSDCAAVAYSIVFSWIHASL